MSRTKHRATAPCALSSAWLQHQLTNQKRSQLEKESLLVNHFANNLDDIEPGLELYARNAVEFKLAPEKKTKSPRIDILARAADGAIVVIECKLGQVVAEAVGQIAGYVSFIRSKMAVFEEVRVVLIGRSVSHMFWYALRELPGVKVQVYKYRCANPGRIILTPVPTPLLDQLRLQV